MQTAKTHLTELCPPLRNPASQVLGLIVPTQPLYFLCVFVSNNLPFYMMRKIN